MNRATTMDWAAHASGLQEALSAYPPSALRQALDQALMAIGSAEFLTAIAKADAALAFDPSCAVAWRLVGLGREGLEDRGGALEAYGAANALDPQSADILADLGRLAMSLDLPGVASEFFARAMVIEPGSAHLTKQLAIALRDGHQHQRAKEVIAAALKPDPDNALLWNALGSVALQEGDSEGALAHLDRALALTPDWPEALYNRAIAKLELADLPGAGEDCDAALIGSPLDQQPAVRFLRAQVRLAKGDLSQGWHDYGARNDPSFTGAPTYLIEAPRWTPDIDFNGLRLLVVGEQGLGDEIMFGCLIRDLVAAIGPKGHLFLGVTPRLAALFQRSYPSAQIITYAIEGSKAHPLVCLPIAPDQIDAWTPMGDLLSRLRPTVESFRHDGGYLAPSKDQVKGWSKALATLGPKPKIGLSWKSMKVYGHRYKQYAPFAAWEPVLRVPGVDFVNLQYGDCAEDIEAAKALGVEIWEAPGLDLTNDIDGAAALSGAIDLLIGVGNASSNLAAAVGTPTWYLFPPAAWPKLGGSAHPWFPFTRGFSATRFGRWDAPLQEIAAALSTAFPAG